MPVQEYTGWLYAFSDQGMEGRFEWALQDVRYAQRRTGGWDQRGAVFFEDGDELKVLGFADTVLWSGVVRKVLAPSGLHFDRFGRLRRVSIFEDESCTDWIPDGVAFDQWDEWFSQNPPLKGLLKRST